MQYTQLSYVIFYAPLYFIFNSVEIPVGATGPYSKKFHRRNVVNVFVGAFFGFNRI